MSDSAPPTPETDAEGPARGRFWLGLVRDWGLALVVAVVIFVGWSLFMGSSAFLSSGEAPDFTLNDMEGKPVQLSALRGEPVVVNFWATWCGPCKAEMPALDAWAADNPEVPLLGVSVDRNIPPGRLRRFVESTGLSYPILHDRDGSVADAWHVDTLPTTVVVTADGHIGSHHVGRIDEKGLGRLVDEAAEHSH